ncbi:spore germination protein KA [Aneurinibacillus soli]|uniref:Spore germination protein A1 n=2 Tax=Aneurinibacillus soli TaxID=1500254 RepID=A0A0U5AXD5_9BACL|nr:spore germination protein KA [Aneurinibacillus soli]BAU28389.1 Spore germination protein A1 [Aneurinibacillus soli]
MQASIDAIKANLCDTEDLIIKKIQIENNEGIGILYLGSIADPTDLLTKLVALPEVKKQLEIRAKNRVGSIEEAVEELITGCTIFLLENATEALSVDTVSVNTRSVTEPDSEVTIKGPHDGFNESLGNNIALIRFHCPSSRLKVEFKKLGSYTKNTIAILSIQGIVNDKILQEVHNRISTVPFEEILDVNYLEEWLTDNKFTIFPLMETSERPDRVTGALLEGRVVIMLNAVPGALIVPFVFFQSLQVSEDYYWPYYISSILRLIRLFCVFVTLFLPAFYIATVTYHHEFLPTSFLMSMVQGREPVPYPTIIEVLMMEGIFEILREAGIRLPRQVGSAVSIVGGLVLGQAAVQAGIVSPATVILVAFTGICSFTLPATSTAYAIRFLRFLVILLAGALGYVGLMAGTIFLFTHLTSLRSFGVPYLSPLAPFNLFDSTDTFIRRPLPLNKKRPSLFRTKDLIRFRKK